jgi:nitrogen fixation-related uncharacterized protein
MSTEFSWKDLLKNVQYKDQEGYEKVILLDVSEAVADVSSVRDDGGSDSYETSESN